MNMIAVARALLLGVEIILALPVLYLLAIAVGAVIGTVRQGRLGHEPESTRVATPRFAVLVPAHNEEMLIAKALQSLAALDYPTDRFTINVIADNCTDHTADIARAAGAVVYERANDEKRGKGYALAWAFERLMHDDARYDAYVVLDADAVVDSQFLKALAGGVARGALALQSHNAVLNAAESETSALRWLALSLMNYIRPLGRNVLGGSSTLTGNGMCLTHELLARHPWQAFGLSEDYQYYLSIVASGEKALFVPRANVRSVMPTTARQLTTQDIRWETISPDAQSWQRRIAWLLLRDSVRHFSWVRLDALAELLTPPLSVLASGCAVALVGALLLAAPLQLVLAGALSIALFAYVASAFILLRPPLGVYRAVAYAPFYIARKLWVYFVLRRQSKNSSTWVRTSRTA